MSKSVLSTAGVLLLASISIAAAQTGTSPGPSQTPNAAPSPGQSTTPGQSRPNPGQATPERNPSTSPSGRDQTTPPERMQQEQGPNTQGQNATPNRNRQQNPSERTQNPSPSAPNQATNPSQQGETTGSINLSTEQRTNVTRVIKERHINIVRQNTTTSTEPPRVGIVVERSIRLAPIPVEIVHEAPSLSRYRYYVVADEMIIVDPANYRVVEVIPIG